MGPSQIAPPPLLQQRVEEVIGVLKLIPLVDVVLRVELCPISRTRQGVKVVIDRYKLLIRIRACGWMQVLEVYPRHYDVPVEAFAVAVNEFLRELRDCGLPNREDGTMTDSSTAAATPRSKAAKEAEADQLVAWLGGRSNVAKARKRPIHDRDPATPMKGNPRRVQPNGPRLLVIYMVSDLIVHVDVELTRGASLERTMSQLQKSLQGFTFDPTRVLAPAGGDTPPDDDGQNPPGDSDSTTKLLLLAQSLEPKLQHLDSARIATIGEVRPDPEAQDGAVVRITDSIAEVVLSCPGHSLTINVHPARPRADGDDAGIPTMLRRLEDSIPEVLRGEGITNISKVDASDGAGGGNDDDVVTDPELKGDRLKGLRHLASIPEEDQYGPSAILGQLFGDANAGIVVYQWLVKNGYIEVVDHDKRVRSKRYKLTLKAQAVPGVKSTSANDEPREITGKISDEDLSGEYQECLALLNEVSEDDRFGAEHLLQEHMGEESGTVVCQLFAQHGWLLPNQEGERDGKAAFELTGKAKKKLAPAEPASPAREEVELPDQDADPNASVFAGGDALTESGLRSVSAAPTSRLEAIPETGRVPERVIVPDRTLDPESDVTASLAQSDPILRSVGLIENGWRRLEAQGWEVTITDGQIRLSRPLATLRSQGAGDSSTSDYAEPREKKTEEGRD